MRNIVNFKEIEQQLEAWRNKYSLPLTQIFINQNVRNYLYREAPLREEIDFPIKAHLSQDPLLIKISEKGGPFHSVRVDLVNSYLLGFIEKVVLLEVSKEIKHPLEITSLELLRQIPSFTDVANSEPTAEKQQEIIVFTDGIFNLFEIFSNSALLEEGREMNNCLGKHEKYSPRAKFYSLRTLEGKRLVSVKYQNSLIDQARERFDEDCSNPTYKEFLRKSLTSLHGQSPRKMIWDFSNLFLYGMPLSLLSLSFDFLAYKALGYKGISEYFVANKYHPDDICMMGFVYLFTGFALGMFVQAIQKNLTRPDAKLNKITKNKLWKVLTREY